MLVNRSNKFTTLLLLAIFFILLMPAHAHAYIGPGAGFAVAGSLLAIFSALLAGTLALFTWPIRYIIRAIRGRHAFAKSRIKKFVILGLDGMDPTLTEKFLKEDKLPNLAKLQKKGCFKKLATTIPSISPVARENDWPSYSVTWKTVPFIFLTK